MTADQAAAFINAQAALLNCRIAGMVAENMQRGAVGQSMAYVEHHFVDVEREFEGTLGHNAALRFFDEHAS